VSCQGVRPAPTGESAGTRESGAAAGPAARPAPKLDEAGEVASYGSSRHVPGCSCLRCRGFQPGNEVALSHGATSERQIRPVARNHRRGFCVICTCVRATLIRSGAATSTRTCSLPASRTGSSIARRTRSRSDISRQVLGGQARKETKSARYADDRSRAREGAIPSSSSRTPSGRA
jgi:hypothetical protein